MSIESRQREVARYTKDIADLNKKDADEAKKEVSKSKELNQAQKSLRTTKSDSMAKSYQQKVIRLQDEISKISVKRADISKRIADKTKLLHRAEKNLLKEKESERKKLEAVEKKREREQLAYQQKITNELRYQRQLASRINLNQTVVLQLENKQYDVFISHASEDKESLVEPLTLELKRLGYDVWYDNTALKVGDSLRQKIDQGLASSRYGIVVLSEAFFAKNWPQYELNGLVAREMNGRKVILPIWHKVSKDEVLSFSPSLADKVALNSSISSISEIASQLAEVLSDTNS